MNPLSRPRFRPRIGRLLNEDRLVSVPKSAEDWLRQGFIIFIMTIAYEVSRALAISVVDRSAEAERSGMTFMNFEKALGIYIEPWVQARVSSVHPLMSGLVWLYQDFHLPIIVATLSGDRIRAPCQVPPWVACPARVGC